MQWFTVPDKLPVASSSAQGVEIVFLFATNVFFKKCEAPVGLGDTIIHAPQDAPSLAIAFNHGAMQIMRNELDNGNTFRLRTESE